MDDDFTEFTQMVREVLFGRTLAEVLEGRNMTVTYGIVTASIPAQTTPISVKILFETAVHLPGEIPSTMWFDEETGLWMSGTPLYPGVIEIDTGEGFQNIVTLPGYIGDLDFDSNGRPPWIAAPIELNGEIVVNGEVIAAPVPTTYGVHDGSVVMVPLRAVAEALGYDVLWNEELQSVQLGVAINLWIGQEEFHIGRMAPLGLQVPPTIIDNYTFVPLNFFRIALNQNAYVFEGQIVIETETDMF